MRYYLAPLEGITGYIMRNTYHNYFEPADKYFIPFISPTYTRKFGSKEINDILPEHNQGMYAVPQVLTNKAEDFLWTLEWLREYGYEEVNLNLGCPSKTVVTKHRGSGFLSQTEELDRFFEEVFSKMDVKISVKTRIGKFEPEEFEELLQIYNRYPIHELIVHPRVQQEYYKGKPHWDVFGWAYEKSKNPVCYNGDIFTATDYEQLLQQFPNLNCVMLGRGILRNPALIGQLKYGEAPKKEQIKAYHDELYAKYQEVLFGEKTVLFKMKEFWFYLDELFEDNKKYIKQIRKAEKLSVYENAVNTMFLACDMKK